MIVSALFRTPHPNRLELLIASVAQGPMISAVLGPFNPIRDVQVYVGGAPVQIVSAHWDAPGNKYVIYVDEDMTANKDLIQIIHHVPEPPFFLASNPTLANLSRGGNPTLADQLRLL